MIQERETKTGLPPYVIRRAKKDGFAYYYRRLIRDESGDRKPSMLRLPDVTDPQFERSYRRAQTHFDFRDDSEVNAVLEHLVNRSKARAATAGYEHCLTTECLGDIARRQKFQCALTGEFLVFSRKREFLRLAASIDRIFSDVGYTFENCRLVTFQANIAKNRWSDGEFIDMCRKVVAASDGSTRVPREKKQSPGSL